MLIRPQLCILLSVFFTGLSSAAVKQDALAPESFDPQERFGRILAELENEKSKSIQMLEDIYLNASDLETRIGASLALAVYHNRNNPRLSQQYLATAMELKDPFAEDRYLAATAAYFRINFYRHGQTGELIRELTTLTQNRHLPWKMLKASFEMLLDHHLKLGDHNSYIKTFEEYQRKIPRFAVEDQHLKQFLTILRVENQENKYLRNLQTLASRYPLSEEARWAFEELSQYNVASSGTRPNSAMTLNFLRNVYLNTIVAPESRQAIIDQLDSPLRISRSSPARLLTDFEKIRFLLRLSEHNLALKLAEKMQQEAQNGYLRLQGGLWRAHILGELGRFEEAITEYQQHVTPKAQVGNFFMESYASNLMRSGQYLAAAEAYQRVRRQHDHYRLRWYTFWNMSRSEKPEDALAILNSHPHIFFENQRSPDSHLYWSLMQTNDKEQINKVDPDEAFTGRFRHYYGSLLKARQKKSQAQLLVHTEDSFQDINLGFNFEYFISNQVGPSVHQVHQIQRVEEKKKLYASNEANFSLPSISLASLKLGESPNQSRQPSLPFRDEVDIIAHNLDLDPYLLYALMRAESSFNPVAMSPVGARGIMQIMPYTAIKLASVAGDREFHLDQLGDPILSIVYGSLYFKMLHEAFEGNTFLTIAAYNAGPQAVYRWLRACNNCEVDEFVEFIPFRETRNYVKRVLSYYVEYQTGKSGQSPLVELPDLPDSQRISVAELF